MVTSGQGWANCLGLPENSNFLHFFLNLNFYLEKKVKVINKHFQMQKSNTLILKTAKNTKPVFATMTQFMFVRPNLIVAKFVFIRVSIASQYGKTF